MCLEIENSGILRDKAMDNKSVHNPIDVMQNYPFCSLNQQRR